LKEHSLGGSEQNPMKNVGNTSRGRSQGVMKIFGHHVGLYGALRGHLCDSNAFFVCCS